MLRFIIRFIGFLLCHEVGPCFPFFVVMILHDGNHDQNRDEILYGLVEINKSCKRRFSFEAC